MVARLRPLSRVLISVDTRNAAVAERALEAGADIVNDVSALGDPRMAEVVARAKAGLVLMHMKGTPSTMQSSPSYRDVVAEVTEYLGRAIDEAESAGVSSGSILVDPGIGFGKTLEHNLTLLHQPPVPLGALEADPRRHLAQELPRTDPFGTGPTPRGHR